MNKEKSKKISNSQFTILEEMKNINISYESLKPLEPEIDTISMFQKFKEILCEKNSDWTLYIGTINYLRRVHKYDKTLFGQFFYGTKMYSKLLELINSVRSSVSKNALLLIIEILSENSPENNSSVLSLVKEVLPLLISKINSNQSFIKAECKQLLESICTNVKFPELLLIILQIMNTSSKAVSTPNSRSKEKDLEILSDLFIKSVKNIGKEILISYSKISEIIKCLTSFYDANKNVNGKFCKKIMDSLIETMDKVNFDTKIEKCGKKEKDAIAIISKIKFEENKKIRGTVSSMHIRKNLQERKKSFNLSKCNNTSFDKGNKSVTIKFNPKKKEGIVVNKKSNMMNLHQNDENVLINN